MILGTQINTELRVNLTFKDPDALVVNVENQEMPLNRLAGISIVGLKSPLPCGLSNLKVQYSG